MRARMAPLPVWCEDPVERLSVHQVSLQHDLAKRAAGRKRLLRHHRGRIVADVRIQRGRKHRRTLHQAAATFDVGFDSGPLRAGMVFTIEPALRIPEERLYIRLEDLIVITETGKDVPSLFVPMDIEGVERVMKEEGMLQRYPGDK